MSSKLIAIYIFCASVIFFAVLTVVYNKASTKVNCLANQTGDVDRISGSELKASEAVYAKFSEILAKKEKNNELGSFLGLVENYEVIISEDDNSYIFHIKPKLFHGRVLNGGSADYVVRKTDSSIEKIIFSK